MTSAARWGRAALKTPKKVTRYTTTATTPAQTGEATQETMMPVRPFIVQFKQPQSVAVTVMPTTPPTMACVVETGMLKNVTARRKRAAPQSAPNIPNWYIAMLLSQKPQAQQSGSVAFATPFWILLDTPAPRRVAPRNSAAPPRRQALRSPMAPDPTLVPQELAASLPPMPKAMVIPTRAPSITIHTSPSGFAMGLEYAAHCPFASFGVLSKQKAQS
mmetsp:Transcript_73226/g.218475  ORF Transcript_73226/g.218475 Transcript_73226/m.218475 type:complete len:217 (+) Transcript_73226:94-744(+)